MSKSKSVGYLQFGKDGGVNKRILTPSYLVKKKKEAIYTNYDFIPDVKIIEKDKRIAPEDKKLEPEKKETEKVEPEKKEIDKKKPEPEKKEIEKVESNKTKTPKKEIEDKRMEPKKQIEEVKKITSEKILAQTDNNLILSKIATEPPELIPNFPLLPKEPQDDIKFQIEELKSQNLQILSLLRDIKDSMERKIVKCYLGDKECGTAIKLNSELIEFRLSIPGEGKVKLFPKDFGELNTETDIGLEIAGNQIKCDFILEDNFYYMILPKMKKYPTRIDFTL